MVYTDGVHLIGDSLAELHDFARLINLKRCWFENNRKPHYDLGSKNNLFRKNLLEKAILHGAVKLTDRELINIINGSR